MSARSPVVLFFTLIAWILHPLLMPSWIFLILDRHHEAVFATGLETDELVLMILLLTGLFPGFLMLMMRNLGLIDSLVLPDREQRTLPGLILAGVYTLVAGYFFVRFPTTGIGQMLLVIALPAVVAAVITFRMKISVHATAAVTCATIVNTHLLTGPYAAPEWAAASVILAGLVMSSRWALKAHTTKEVYIGAAAGLISSLLALRMFR